MSVASDPPKPPCAAQPENVLLDERGHIKLADFGTAKAETLPTRVRSAHAAAAIEIARSEASSRASAGADDASAGPETPSDVGPPSAIGRSVSSGMPGPMPSHRVSNSTESVDAVAVTDRHRSAARTHASVMLATALDHAASSHAAARAGDGSVAHEFVGTAGESN